MFRKTAMEKEIAPLVVNKNIKLIVVIQMLCFQSPSDYLKIM
jgi:hypothetical protein